MVLTEAPHAPGRIHPQRHERDGVTASRRSSSTKPHLLIGLLAPSGVGGSAVGGA